MVVRSDWFKLFSPKGVQPNIKMRVPMILSDPLLSLLCQIWLFLLLSFCVVPMHFKEIKVYTKTFVIATLFWEKWCIFWKSSRGANTFVHDCI